MNFLAIYGVISLSAQYVNRFSPVHYDVRKEETSMLLLLRSYKIIYNYRKKIQVKLERRKYPSCFSCRLPAWIYI